ncbi:hypothetical protein BDA99DRAFT_540202 [Phascolomyces articulosus]|uniref:Uncharacterized protein n=1 Tax=Phascolomyces articulosus TaxID=60185 RepID=A0AAD5JTZ5_9FUNG|nr:hypothetical protein BDA99DRAFT_540202 [Phascolomyces articulosus]
MDHQNKPELCFNTGTKDPSPITVDNIAGNVEKKRIDVALLVINLKMKLYIIMAHNNNRTERRDKSDLERVFLATYSMLIILDVRIKSAILFFLGAIAIKNKIILLTIITLACAPTLSIHFKDEWGYSAGQIGLISLAIGLPPFFSVPLPGYLYDRLGPRYLCFLTIFISDALLLPMNILTSATIVKESYPVCDTPDDEGNQDQQKQQEEEHIHDEECFGRSYGLIRSIFSVAYCYNYLDSSNVKPNTHTEFQITSKSLCR